MKFLSFLLFCGVALAQQDPLQSLNEEVSGATGKMLRFTFEERTRWEEKYGVTFGKAVNQQDMMSRIRVGAQFRLLDWLTISAMGQDSRVPFYGVVAPNTIRDSMDLHEAYVDLFGQRKTGFGALFGRQMQDYGESRLIGSPQWSNVSKTYDLGKVYYRTPKMRLEVLMVSPVKIRPDQFNVPDLGERIWGTYDTFSNVAHGASFDIYALRHSQNRIGGWASAGTLGTDSFGGRFYGPLRAGLSWSLEGVGQTGHSGVKSQRAYAWFSNLTEKTTVMKHSVSYSIEYKVASGTKQAQASSGTFDQLSPANHDKFGHEDLFGWRNLRTLKSLESFNVTKPFALNFMYTNEWLYSATDALYNSQGGSIAVSAKGTAGTHVGQEADLFATYKWGAHTFGGGFGHFFKGEFVDSATAHINPRYFYIFQQYSFR